MIDIEVKINKKISEIYNKFNEILDSWKIKNIIEYNEKFKEYAGNYTNKIKGINYLINKIIEILSDIEKNKGIKNNIVMDKKFYTNITNHSGNTRGNKLYDKFY